MDFTFSSEWQASHGHLFAQLACLRNRLSMHKFWPCKYLHRLQDGPQMLSLLPNTEGLRSVSPGPS